MPGDFDCELCGVECGSIQDLLLHEDSETHRKNLPPSILLGKKNIFQPPRDEKLTNIMVHQQQQLSNIQILVQHAKGGQVLLSALPTDYERLYRKKIVYTGKLKKYIDKVPNVRVVGSYVKWTGAPVGKKKVTPAAASKTTVESNNNIVQQVVKVEKKSEEVKIAVHDSSEDIVTFRESISGKLKKQSVVDEADESGLEVQACLESILLSVEEENASPDEVARSLFLPMMGPDDIRKNKGMSLFGSSSIDKHNEGALFGHLFPESESETNGGAVYLNTHEPFCFVTVGVQGAGKSHTSSCVLESCLVPFSPGDIVRLNAPMLSMVLHYDQNTSSICEAAGLLSPSPSIKARMKRSGHDVGAVPKDKAVILVSPAFYRQRKKFYGDYCTVKPLLFRWRSMTADHIKRIMRIESGDNQLYVASFLDLLRGYQRKAVIPEFSDFMNQVRKVCNVGSQKGPLDQRIALLESVVAESQKNVGLVEESLDLITCSKEGYHLIITDLTDPLLSKEEANGLFQVLTEQFRTLPTKGGKVLCLDEAHKYMTGEKADGLSEAIVNAARLMRHDGVRLVVSTQSPKALAPELLELVTVAALHHFHSPDWWSYLQSKLPLHQDAFERILSLSSGEAVAFATSHDLTVENVEGSHCLPMRIRPRITEDLGSSRRNS